MTAGRGRVIKSRSVATAGARVPWEPRASLEEAPPAEIEVVRDSGVVTAISVKCRCGRTHELELVPAGGPARKEQGVGA